MASSSQALPHCSPRTEIKFLVEALSTRNEELTTEIEAEIPGDAKERATEQFMCEGHCLLSATASEMKGQ